MSADASVLQGWQRVRRFAVHVGWRNPSVALPDVPRRRRSAVQEQARHGDGPALTAWLDAGLDPHLRTEHGHTMLHLIVWLPEPAPLLERLLAAGLDIDARNRYGETPLRYAIDMGGSTAAIRALATTGGWQDAAPYLTGMPYEVASDPIDHVARCGQSAPFGRAGWDRSRMMRRLFGAGLVTGVFVALTAGVGTPAGAVEKPTKYYSTLRLCDPTACYVAWSVVDSDHDGVCDADELQAGSDPYDAASRPGLKLIIDLLIDRKLPSFEYGFASMLAIPAEIIKARETLGVDPLGAFPVNERADALTRMGISADQLSKFGISPDHSGFSLGLEGIEPDGNGKLADFRIGGIEASLISEDAKDPRNHVFGGGVVDRYTTWTGKDVRVYGDGSRETVTHTSHGTSTEITDSEGNNAGTRTSEGGSHMEGTTEVVNLDEKFLDSDGNLIGSKSMEYRKEKNGSSTEVTVETQYIRDGDGKLVGSTATTTTEHTSSSGATSTTTTTTVCDSTGKQCTSTTDTKKYADPEQAYNSMVTQETVDGVLRLRGAAVNVVPGWSAPGMGEQPTAPLKLSTIMLIDGTVGELFVLTEPNLVTQAQPEGHPGLPSPRDAGKPPGGGGCEGLC